MDYMIDALCFVVLPLAAVYGAAYGLFVAAHFFVMWLARFGDD